jgi:hypothetical protein
MRVGVDAVIAVRKTVDACMGEQGTSDELVSHV